MKKLPVAHVEILEAAACSKLIKYHRGWGRSRSGPFYADRSIGALVGADLLIEKGHPLGRIAVLSALAIARMRNAALMTSAELRSVAAERAS